MRESHWCSLVGIRGWIIAVAMLCATMMFIAGCTSGDCATGFPTGRFIHEQDESQAYEYDGDGTWRYYLGNMDEPAIQGKYCVNGDLFTEMTHDYPGSPEIPATYTWAFDGQKLTFHLWGEDVNPHRQNARDGQTYIQVE